MRGMEYIWFLQLAQYFSLQKKSRFLERPLLNPRPCTVPNRPVSQHLASFAGKQTFVLKSQSKVELLLSYLNLF